MNLASVLVLLGIVLLTGAICYYLIKKKRRKATGRCDSSSCSDCPFSEHCHK